MPDDNISNNVVTEKSLAFFGTISASISHEINNVFTSINEISGLLADLCIAAERGRPLDMKKIATSSKSISDQVQRGITIVRRFNKFVHSADEPLTTFEPGEYVITLIELCRRLAMINNIQIKFVEPSTPIAFTGNPFNMQYAIFIYINAALTHLEKNGVIEISLQNTPNNMIIELDLKPIADMADLIKQLPSLDNLAEKICDEVNSSTCYREDSAKITITYRNHFL